MSGTIVLKHEGHLLPEAFFDKVIEANPTCVGYACKTTEGLITERAVEKASAGVILDEAFKDTTTLYFFGNFEDPFNVDDIQPFTIIADTAGNPILTAFVEGDYDFSEESSGHSDAFAVANDYLIEKITEMFELAGKDAVKFKQLLRSKMMSKDIDNLSVDTGVVCLMFADGEIITFQKPDGAITEFEWGWTSDTHGYGDKPVEVPAEQPAMSMLERLKAKKAKAPITPPKAADPAPKEAPFRSEPARTEAATYPPDTGTNVLGPENENKLWRWRFVQCPTSIKDFKGAQKWYRNNAGFEVPEPLKYPRVQSTKQKDLIPADTKGVHKTEAVARPVNEPAKTAAETATANDTRLHDFVKIVDKSNQAIPDPQKIQEEEAKWRSFIQMANMDDLERTFNWPMSTRVKLCNDFSTAAAVLQMNLTSELVKARMDVVRMKNELAQLTPKPAKKEETNAERIVRLAAENRLKKAM